MDECSARFVRWRRAFAPLLEANGSEATVDDGDEVVSLRVPFESTSLHEPLAASTIEDLENLSELDRRTQTNASSVTTPVKVGCNDQLGVAQRIALGYPCCCARPHLELGPASPAGESIGVGAEQACSAFVLVDGVEVERDLDAPSKISGPVDDAMYCSSVDVACTSALSDENSNALRQIGRTLIGSTGEHVPFIEECGHQH